MTAPRVMAKRAAAGTLALAVCLVGGIVSCEAGRRTAPPPPVPTVSVTETAPAPVVITPEPEPPIDEEDGYVP